MQDNPANNHNDFIEELAFFGEVSYDLTDTLEVTTGVRVADVKQRFQRTATGTDDTPVSPKLVLSWQPLDELLVYGGYTTGFRPGNVNNNLQWYADTIPTLNTEVVLSGRFFDGDDVESYELGVKTTLLDGRVALLGAVYRLDWNDMIVHEVNPIIGNGDLYNVNSGGAEISGVELEKKAHVTDHLHIRIAGDVNDTEVTRAAEFSSSAIGTELIHAPANSLSVAIDYSLSLSNGATVDFYLDHAWVSKQYTDTQNTQVLPRFDRSNGRITFRSADEKWRVSLFGTNLTNEEILRGRTATGVLFWHNPRQVGLEFGYQLWEAVRELRP